MHVPRYSLASYDSCGQGRRQLGNRKKTGLKVHVLGPVGIIFSQAMALELNQAHRIKWQICRNFPYAFVCITI